MELWNDAGYFRQNTVFSQLEVRRIGYSDGQNPIEYGFPSIGILRIMKFRYQILLKIINKSLKFRWTLYIVELH